MTLFGLTGAEMKIEKFRVVINFRSFNALWKCFQRHCYKRIVIATTELWRERRECHF